MTAPNPLSWLFPQPLLELRIPLTGDVSAGVVLPQPMTEEQWQQFRHILETMKPGIVRAPTGDTP
jgi:hypothetical protein